MRTTGSTPMATIAQIKYLHGLYRALGWDEDQYRSVLYNDYKVESTTALTLNQANELIRLLQSVINNETALKVSQKQMVLIRSLWKPIDYSDGEQGDLHLNAFVQKRFKKSRIDQLTKEEAIKMISQIKAMAKQAKEREGKTVVINKLASCVYCHAPIMWVQLKSKERVPFDCVSKPGRDYEATNFHNCKTKRS